MQKYCLIVNPLAGRGSALKAIPEIESILNGLELDYDIILTEYPGHAIELAKEAGANGYQTVVSVGGDGTANEVINGLMQDANAGNLSANLAVLPVGRGNDFSYGMGVPQDLEEACKALAVAKTRPIDVGLVKGGDYPEGRYFGNGVGIGFDTIVGFEAAKLPKFISGIPAYLIAAVKTIFLYFRAPMLRVELDDEVIEQPCLLVSLMNGRRMGGSFMFAPESEQDDGFLNLCIVEGVSRREILKIFPKVMNGTQGEHEAVKMPLSQHVKITAVSGSLPVHADGETICEAGTKLEVSILKQQLQMICG